MESRRDALILIAATAAAAKAQHNHPSPEPAAPKPTQPKVFTAEEMRLLDLLTDLIIPKSDTLGAAEAGVSFLLDSMAAKNPKLLETWRTSLAAVRPKFAGLSGERAQEVLGGMTDDPFFALLKNTTIDLYYSTREGLTNELGWHGDTYLAEFVGCTHPEHQI